MPDRKLGLILPNDFEVLVQKAEQFRIEGEASRDAAIRMLGEMCEFLESADLPDSRLRLAAAREYFLGKGRYTEALTTFQNIYRSEWRLKYGESSDPGRLVDKLFPIPAA